MITIEKIRITTEFLTCKTEGKLAEYLTGLLQFEDIKKLNRSELITDIRHLLNNVEECKLTNSEIASFMVYYDYNILTLIECQDVSVDVLLDHLIVEIVNHTRIELTIEYDA